MRILDPYANAASALRERLPDADVHTVDEGLLYDAVVCAGVLDRVASPDLELCQLMAPLHAHGRLIVALRFGGQRGDGRHRDLRPVDLALLLRRHGRIVSWHGDETGATVTLERHQRHASAAILVAGSPLAWDPVQITTGGLGGLETSAWRVSRALATLGFDVTLYGEIAGERDLHDVMIRHRQAFNPLERRDLLVVYHDASVLNEPANAETVLLWLTNAGRHHGLTPANAQNITRVLALSGWHASEIAGSYPWLDPAKITTISNAIHHPFFEQEGEDGGLEREPRVVFSSHPERGLTQLLELWPQVQERVPDARLVCTYPPYADGQGISGLLERAEQMAGLGVSVIRGGLAQDALARLMCTSRVWAHPALTPTGERVFETSCISALEAQAAGLVVVAGGWGALPETAQGCCLIDTTIQPQLVDALVAGLIDPDIQAAARVLGPQAVKHRDWLAVADVCASMMTPPR